MTREEAYTFHSLYSAVHQAHKQLPTVWTDHECNRILTAIMAAKPFSWRVIGITREALRMFQSVDFRYQSRLGLTRAHLRPRIETVRKLLSGNDPCPEDQFMDFWIENDQTILCARGENTAAIPQYIKIENADGALFSCAGKLAGWHHGTAERAFLRALYHENFG